LKGIGSNKSIRYFFYGNQVTNFPNNVGQAGIITISCFGLLSAMEILDINKNLFTLCVWTENTITPETWYTK
jgi:hypothetical protein